LSIAGYRYRPNEYFFLDLVPSYIETKVWSDIKDGEDDYDLTRFLTVRARAGLVLPIGPAHVGLAVDLLPSNVPSFGLRLVIGLNY